MACVVMPLWFYVRQSSTVQCWWIFAKFKRSSICWGTNLGFTLFIVAQLSSLSDLRTVSSWTSILKSWSWYFFTAAASFKTPLHTFLATCRDVWALSFLLGPRLFSLTLNLFGFLMLNFRGAYLWRDLGAIAAAETALCERLIKNFADCYSAQWAASCLCRSRRNVFDNARNTC